jgi:hypothetical protein
VCVGVLVLVLPRLLVVSSIRTPCIRSLVTLRYATLFPLAMAMAMARSRSMIQKIDSPTGR